MVVVGFYDSAHIKDDDCGSGSLPEVLQYRVWPVSRTETFNTQVHWLNPPKEIIIEPNHPSEINPNSDSRIEKWWSFPAVCAIPGRPVSRTETKITSLSLSLPTITVVGWCLTTVPVTKTIRLSEWVTPGDTAKPGMTSLKDGDF